MGRTRNTLAGAAARIAFSTVMCLAPLGAQTNLLTDPPNVSGGGGSVATGSYSIGRIESVNAINGNMTLRIPAAHLPPGPGGFSAGVDLVYNSTIFDLKTQVPTDNSSVFQSEYVPSAHGGGWKYGYKYTLWSQTRVSEFTSATCNAINNDPVTAGNWYKTVFATPDGANRALRLVGALDGNGNTYYGDLSTDSNQSYDLYDFAGYTNQNCQLNRARFQGTLIFATGDSTFIRVEANTVSLTWVAYFPDGTQVSGPIIVTAGHAIDSDANQIKDRNGNTIGITGNCNIGTACTETLLDGQGRSVTMSYAATSSNGWTDTITWPGPPDDNGNATTSTTNVNWIAWRPYALPYYWRTLQTGATYTGSGDTVSLGSGGWTAMVVSSVQLPPASIGNSINYLFNYGPLTGGPNAYSWGEIHEVEMCTGAAPNNCQAQWKEQYAYQFDSLPGMPDSPSAQRPPGTLTNPIASKTFLYGEDLQGVHTPLQETTSYYSTFAPNIYTYPATSGPNVVGSQITYPDGSYSLIYTNNLCPSNLKSRDLCVSVPFKTLNRDGSVTEMSWVSNTLADGVPAGALFNPYVQYTVITPPGSSAPVKIRYAQRDRNGNVTSTTEYDWAAASAVNRDTNTGVITSVCGQGTTCTALSSTVTTYWSAGTSYWTHSSPGYLGAPHTTATGSSTKTFTFDNAATSANLLYLDEYNSETSANIRTSWTYLSNGNVSSVTDPNLHSTVITYGCGPNSNVYPSTMTIAGTLNATYTYDCASGFLKSVQDTDNHITTSYTYDGMGRTKSVKEKNTATALERTTTTTYDDANFSVTSALGQLSTTTTFDALGRVQSTVDGLNRRVEKAYRYGTGGTSYELTSNPYISTGEATMGWTLTTRTVGTPNSTTPDAVTVTGYAGAALPGVWGGSSPNSNATGTVTTTSNVIVSGVTGCSVATTVKDAANNTRTNCVDGAGRLASVLEPTGVLTTNGYDALSNLISVSAQCLNVTGHTCSPVGTIGSPRTFTYTSLSRLLSATNPESGTSSYTYYANGNLHTRTDANGSVATYTYDALDRPLTITYSLGTGVNATPGVAYTYDSNSVGAGFTGFVGAPSSVSSTASKMEYSYDGLGRIVASRQTTPGTGTPYTFGYEYSLTDQLTSITYPSGRKVEYTLDAADEPTRVDGTPPGGSKSAYASNITYTAAGDLSSLPFANGITESHTWNSLMQHTGISAGNLLSLNYGYCNNGAAQCATGNSGSPWQQTIAVGGQTMAVQSYLHDSLNRISVAAEKTGGTSFTPTCPDSGSVWCRQFGYDNAGNRSIAARTPNGANPWDAGTFNSSNRIADANWSYDGNGNIIKTPVPQTIGYDAENRQVALCTQDPASCPSQYGAGRTVYVYDGLGNRVQKTDNTGTTTFVYDAFGNLAAEYGTSAASPGTQYVTVDALGSTRLLMTGAQASERHDFQPYGDEITGDTGTWRASVTGYPNSLLSSLYAPGTMRQRFTGQERDPESGLDYFHARYFSGVQGRFTSPDPANAGASTADPQSWNGYGYVSSNPLSYTDPSGEGIFGAIFGVVAGLLSANPWVGLAASAAGNGIDAAIWGPGAVGIPGTPLNLGSLTSCGGPLGNCGSLGAGPWSEVSGLGNVADPGRFIFTFGDQQSTTGFWSIDYNGQPFWYEPTGGVNTGAVLRVAPKPSKLSVAGSCAVASFKDHWLGISAATAAGPLPKPLLGERSIGSDWTNLISKFLGRNSTKVAGRTVYGPGSMATNNFYRGLGRVIATGAAVINLGVAIKTGEDAYGCYSRSW